MVGVLHYREMVFRAILLKKLVDFKYGFGRHLCLTPTGVAGRRRLVRLDWDQGWRQDVWNHYQVTLRQCKDDLYESTPVVLNLFYISYPFIKQDHQIYPQYTQSCSFIENTKLTNSYSLEWFIKFYVVCSLWFSKFNPLEDEIYPQG